MKIKKIIPCCVNCDESTVVITDQYRELVCFSYSDIIKEGQELKKPLYASLESPHNCSECISDPTRYIFSKYDSSILMARDKNFMIKKLANTYEYHFTGKLIEKSSGIIAVEGFVIQVDEDIPQDI